MTDAQVINVEVPETFEDILAKIGQGDSILPIEQIGSLERAIEKLNKRNFVGSNTGVPTLYRALALQVGRRIDTLLTERDQHKEEIATLYKLKAEYQSSGGLI